MTPWTIAHQAPLSLEFPRQEYWSGLPFPPLRELPYSGIEPKSPESSALAGVFFITKPPWKPMVCVRAALLDSDATWGYSSAGTVLVLFLECRAGNPPGEALSQWPRNVYGCTPWLPSALCPLPIISQGPSRQWWAGKQALWGRMGTDKALICGIC